MTAIGTGFGAYSNSNTVATFGASSRENAQYLPFAIEAIAQKWQQKKNFDLRQW